MQTILTSRAKALERETGFVQRSSVELDGPIFTQTTVLTWMQTPDASYSQLRHTAASLGVHITTGRYIGTGRDTSGPTSVLYPFTIPLVFCYSA